MTRTPSTLRLSRPRHQGGARHSQTPLPSCLQVGDGLRDVLCEEEAEGFEPSMWIVDNRKKEEGDWSGYY